jgi:transcriptional antiterminator Rof (Rho-off)
MSDYELVSCASHSEYELWIMHGEQLRVRWFDEDGLEHTEVLRPVDLESRQGEEYLVARTENNQRRRIRLDKIAAAQPRR